MIGGRRGLLWAVGGAIVGLLLTVALLTLARLRGTSRPASLSPVLTVIPLPTATAPVIFTPTAPLLPTLTRTPPPDAPKQFTTGQLVEVFGTEGEGLRIRENPNLAADILMLGLENEVFEVVEGPRESDGYTWWRLANPFDPTKQGWAADQFLRSLESAQ
ncbi:MAG: hypothetical protein BMS9Abin28_1982 [Anaerolineae bacterium]|nr:MAG: hypothetical protein BMS9Abin28_1982 [Anaerolineae bacterium]